MTNKNNNNDNLNKKPEDFSSWDAIKQMYKLKRQQTKNERVNKQNELIKKKQEKKEAKKIKKQTIKEYKNELVKLKKDYHTEVEKLNKSKNKDNNEQIKETLNELNQQYINNRVLIYDKIREIRFNYGKRFNTIPWRLTKWTYGIRKEFFRIIWSSPKNTFKYLGIITIIVGFLSLIFLLINYLVTLF